MERAEALRIAYELRDYLGQSCDEIAIAGSIRRRSPEVKDIEIVCIPSRGTKLIDTGLFPERVDTNALFESVKDSSLIEWIKPGTMEILPWDIKADGKYWRGMIREGTFDAPADIKLDLFLATAQNWGVIHAIRTGSADFSRALVTYARDHTEFRVQDGHLVTQFSESLVPCASEEELFNYLQLKFIEPHLRRSAADIQPL